MRNKADLLRYKLEALAQRDLDGEVGSGRHKVTTWSFSTPTRMRGFVAEVLVGQDANCCWWANLASEADRWVPATPECFQRRRVYRAAGQLSYRKYSGFGTRPQAWRTVVRFCVVLAIRAVTPLSRRLLDACLAGCRVGLLEAFVRERVLYR
jgi:hypothetical protein